MKKTSRHYGFALISALFILVILSAVGSQMVTLVDVSRRTTAFAGMNARAHYAARSGIEWAIYEAATTPGSCPAATFNLAEGGVAGFSLTVTCSSSSHTEGGSTQNVLRVVSTASYGTFGSQDFFSRTVEATLSP